MPFDTNFIGLSWCVCSVCTTFGSTQKSNSICSRSAYTFGGFSVAAIAVPGSLALPPWLLSISFASEMTVRELPHVLNGTLSAPRKKLTTICVESIFEFQLICKVLLISCWSLDSECDTQTTSKYSAAKGGWLQNGSRRQQNQKFRTHF